MATNIFGGIGDAIDGGPKLEAINYSNNLNQQLNALTNDQTSQRAAQALDLNRLNQAAIAAGGDISKLSAGDQALVMQIVQQRQDPLATRSAIGNFDFGLVNQAAANIAQQGKAGESRAEAALGYGGRGPSTFTNTTLFDRVSQNLAPVYSQVLASLGQNAASVEASRINQNQNVLGLLNYRAGIPLRAVDAYGIPIQARAAVNQSNIGALGQLGSVYKDQNAGFRSKKTALGSAMSSLDGIVDLAASVYTGGLAGGKGGETPGTSYVGGLAGANSGYGYPNASGTGRSPWGGFSGMFGGNGAQAQPRPTYQPYVPPNAWTPGPSGYGNYGVGYG